MASHAVLSGSTKHCCPAYISSIASIIWSANRSSFRYNLANMVTSELFDSVYSLIKIIKNNAALKYSIDSLLCALIYVKIELFPLLLQKMEVLVPNLSTDPGASISDDRKDCKSMTDDTKQSYEINSEWYERFVIRSLSSLSLSNEQLETIALVSRSPSAIQQLLDSGLPKLLTLAVLEFCSGSWLSVQNSACPMSELDKVTAILRFFSDVSEEKLMRDWLGSSEGSSFWSPLLSYMCKRPFTGMSSLRTEAHTELEEVCVRFLSKCSLCHPTNQKLLAKVLCEVISSQTSGITGFMRRLILQLLLENEKIPVSIKADETLYKNSAVLHPFSMLHPAFKNTHNRALLYLGTNVTLAEILEQYVTFSTSIKSDVTVTNKSESHKNESYYLFQMTADSDLSMAAGVTAKDKRVKDAKNVLTSTPQLKKKRYNLNDNNICVDIIEGRIIKCDSFPDVALPVSLTLSQLLTTIEEQGGSSDWPCIHLTISQSKGIIFIFLFNIIIYLLRI